MRPQTIIYRPPTREYPPHLIGPPIEVAPPVDPTIPRTCAGKPLPRQPIALGDLVERAAKPIARHLDRLTRRYLPPRYHTHLSGCSACSRRRRFLNLLVPDSRSLSSYLTAPKRLRSVLQKIYPPKP